MKKYIAAFAVTAAFAGFSFAQTQTEAAKPAEPVKMEAPKPAAQAPAHHKAAKAAKADIAVGSIAAIDTVKNEITVKDSKGADRVIGVDAAKLATLKVGDNVRVKVHEGKAETVKVIQKHEGHKAQPKK